MNNLKMKLNQYEINIDLDNPNVLIYGKVGTGKSVLTDKLIKSIKSDFVLIESQNYEDFTSCLCKKGLKESQDKLINQIGNFGNLEMHLLKEIENRTSIENKESLTPILVNLDGLDAMLGYYYEDKFDASAYQFRMNHLFEVGPSLGIYFIITSQPMNTHPIKANLFATKIETQKEDCTFTANINII